MTLKTGQIAAEKSALRSGLNCILKYIKIDISYYKFDKYFPILLFLLYFDQINAACMSI